MSRSQKFVFIVGRCRRSEGKPSIKSTLVQRLLLTLTGVYWVWYRAHPSKPCRLGSENQGLTGPILGRCLHCWPRIKSAVADCVSCCANWILLNIVLVWPILKSLSPNTWGLCLVCLFFLQKNIIWKRNEHQLCKIVMYILIWIVQIYVIFNHLKLWVAVGRHNFKRVFFNSMMYMYRFIL